jgi:hypothetical protein
MQVILEKTSDAPSAESIANAWPCEISSATGNVPTPSTSHLGKQSPFPSLARHPAVPTVAADAAMEDVDLPRAEVGTNGEIKNCLMLNLEHNVRLAYTVPELPCSPCTVTFELSMNTPTNSTSYIALGFKDSSASYLNSSVLPYKLPNYFGMAGDRIGDLSGRMVVGYVSTGGKQCVRQMESQGYTSAPADVPDDGVIHSTAVTSHHGQTVVTFGAEFHAGSNARDLNGIIGSFASNRFSWAMGTVGGDGGCSSSLMYHNAVRGLAPLGFPWYARMCHCGFPSICVDPWPLLAAAAKTPPMLDTDMSVSV